MEILKGFAYISVYIYTCVYVDGYGTVDSI